MIEISIDSIQLERGLGKLLNNATSTRPIMRGTVTELHSLTEDNFQTEFWGTNLWKKSLRIDGKTLQDSGQLAASINTAINNDFTRIGTNKPYAAIHHFGGNIKAKNKPYLINPIW